MNNEREKRVLVLQGGGALGAYQAGAYSALSKAGLEPDWVAGISIGGINGAIIAGNKPEDRVPRLRQLWEMLSSGLQGRPFLTGDGARTLFNEASSWLAMLFGVPGFFSPRVPPPFLHFPGSPEALSYYDTEALQKTLTDLVDFKLLQDGGPRLSVGVVNVLTGNFAYFDSAKIHLRPEHIMASGALPPGLPPVIIDGEPYWDGGLVSNTPLHYVMLEERPLEDLCIFQVDLFPARGELPRSIFEVAEREKEIRYSSRTRLNTKFAEKIHCASIAAKRLLEKLPPELKDDPDARYLADRAHDTAITIVHLINRQSVYDTSSKDYEFSRLSMEEHWEAGRQDVERTLQHDKWLYRSRPPNGVMVLDLTNPAA